MRILGLSLSLVLLAGSVAGLLLEAGIYRGGDLPDGLRLFADTAFHGRGPRDTRWDIRHQPTNPVYWLRLADESASDLNPEAVDYSLDRARNLAAGVPSVLMNIANHRFSQGRIDDALECTARILYLTSSYDAIVFSYYRRFQVPARSVIQSGLPDDARARQAYLADILRWAGPDTVSAAWRTLSETTEFDDELSDEYLAYLIRHDLYRESLDEFKHRLGGSGRGYASHEWVYNGGFEQGASRNPFNWKLRAAGGVRIAFSDSSYEGRQAAVVEFAGDSNVEFRHLSQTLYLPAGEYRFRALLRTERVGGDGFYFRVFDPQNRDQLSIETERVRGTADWTPVTAEFSVTRSMTPVSLLLCRDFVPRVDGRIYGAAWLDAVSVVRLDSPDGGSS